MEFKVMTLVGSRQISIDKYLEVATMYTSMGYLVFSPILLEKIRMSEESFRALMFAKIVTSDSICVLYEHDKGIGKHTEEEINIAKTYDLEIIYESV